MKKATLALICMMMGLSQGKFTQHHPVCNYIKIIARMHPRQLEDLDEVLDSPIDGASFWNITHGYGGLWRRWRNREPLLELCKYHRDNGSISDEDAEYVADRAAKLTHQSMRAAMLSLFRFVAPDKADMASRDALRLYIDISYRTHTLSSVSSAQMCTRILELVL